VKLNDQPRMSDTPDSGSARPWSRSRGRQPRAWAELDAALSGQAESLIHEWTGQTEMKGREVSFLNIGRGDRNLGSAFFNVDTGFWNDWAYPEYKGKGLMQLYAALHTCTLTQAYEALSPMVAVQQHEPVAVTRVRREKKRQERQAEEAAIAEAKPAPVAVPVEPDSIEVPLPPDAHPDLGLATGSWAYHSDHGCELFHVLRFEPEPGKKETRPCIWDGEKWRWAYPAVDALPIFNLPAVKASPKEMPVLVVEGEKTAMAAAMQFEGLAVVTTSAMGSGNAHRSDWSALKGRDVVIVPDADDPGLAYAASAAGEAFVNKAATVCMVATMGRAGWAQGDDMADHQVEPDSFLGEATSVLEAGDAMPMSTLEKGVAGAASRLGPGEYDRQKKALAEMLGIGTRAFDTLVREARSEFSSKVPQGEVGVDPLAAQLLQSGLVDPDDDAPAAEPVTDGDALFDEIVMTIHRHLFVEPDYEVAIAIWIFWSHVINAQGVAPKLLFTSATKRCGKTTALSLVQALSPRPLPASNISVSGIFRVIDVVQPTLLIDEADTFVQNSPELVGVLNSGHTRTMAFVMRVEKDEASGEFVPRKFSTWAAQAIAAIKALTDTLVDRSIVIRLKRAPAGVRKERLSYEARSQMSDLRSQIVRWSADNFDSIKTDDNLLPMGSDARAHANWTTVASVASVIGPRTLERVAQAFARAGNTSDLVEDIESSLLVALAGIFGKKLHEPHGPNDFIPSRELVNKLNAISDAPWADSRNGKGLTEHKLGRILSGLGVKADQLQTGGKRARGFHGSALLPEVERYLSPVEASKAQEDGGDNPSDEGEGK